MTGSMRGYMNGRIPGVSRLVALVEGIEEWELLHEKWRLHNPERDQGIYLISMRDSLLPYVL